MYVTPNPTYKKSNKLTGICGNFNGLSQDDLLLRDKNTMAADDTEFGYEWRDEEDCPYPVSLDPCLENPDRQGWAEKGKDSASPDFLYPSPSLFVFMSSFVFVNHIILQMYVFWRFLYNLNSVSHIIQHVCVFRGFVSKARHD